MLFSRLKKLLGLVHGHRHIDVAADPHKLLDQLILHRRKPGKSVQTDHRIL